jgi:hypothetical protein
LQAIGVAVAALAASAPARAAPTATVSANIVKPVVLTWVQNLDLGTITLTPGAWTGAVVSISRAGVFTCVSVKVTCTGTTQVAKYNLIGNNGQTITISAPSVTMTNQRDPTKTLTLTTDAPASITLTNSGQPGTTFGIGGSITINSTTADGAYVGTFNVTANY